jgi:hypothetical protein
LNPALDGRRFLDEIKGRVPSICFICRFSRRIRGYAKAHDIPVIDCSAGQRKHDLAVEYLAKTTAGKLFYCYL